MLHLNVFDKGRCGLFDLWGTSVDTFSAIDAATRWMGNGPDSADTCHVHGADMGVAVMTLILTEFGTAIW